LSQTKVAFRQKFGRPEILTCLFLAFEIVGIMIATFLFLACSVTFERAQASIRGLNPDYAPQYSGAGRVFKCLDGSKTIPFSRVNDDYCDCPDGSDEPGSLEDL
jgi:hypothetical protein